MKLHDISLGNLRRRKAKMIFLALGLIIGIIAFTLMIGQVSSWAGRPDIPDFMVTAWHSAGFMPLLWIAVIIAAPLGEEILFRGFLFAGIAKSRLGGLGAMTAVLLLIFRDTILSFVASIQINSNDMVRVGDWISMPEFDADGDVMEISLTTVKVR